MKYKLNTENFSTIETFRINTLPGRSYFIPYPGKSSFENLSPLDERYSSPFVKCLNGEWDFKFYPVPSEIPEIIDTDEIAWDKLSVPSCWQFNGYDRPFYLNVRYQFEYNPPKIPILESAGDIDAWVGAKGGKRKYLKHFHHDLPEYNFVGIYRTFIDIPDNSGYILSFLGVASCLDLYVNGEFAGYSEGAHNTAEYDISKFIKKGKNEVVCVVHRWCNGTYLECQDMFRNNGIFRDVLLRRQEDIWDFEIIPALQDNGLYCLECRADVISGCDVRFSLYDAHGCVIVPEVEPEELIFSEIDGHLTAIWRFENLDVNIWSAEKPYIYSAFINTDSVCVRQTVGFKDVSIRGNIFYINGKNVKLHGVNHHDTTPDKGYTMTPKEILRDVTLCKQYNADTVRTSHYPPDPLFLELCTRMGLYVVDETDLETHGVLFQSIPSNYNLISNDISWEKHYLDRVQRLYTRDKNNSCIVMWSLGNEAGCGCNSDSMYNYLKGKTKLPVHYEGAIYAKRMAYDVASMMYPSHELVHSVGKGTCKTRQFLDRPFFMCEYAHAMGVGPGGAEEYWDIIYRHDNLMGGCIWEMNDHAVLHGDGSYTYGGDHGEWIHDGNFCVDGLFYPDRTPSTGAIIMKYLYRPLIFTHVGKNEFEVFNTKGFTHGSEYTVTVCPEEEKPFEITVDVDPLSRLIIGLPIGDNSTFVTFKVRYNNDNKQIISSETLQLKNPSLPRPIVLPKTVPDVKVGKKVVLDLCVPVEVSTVLNRVRTDNDNKNLPGYINTLNFSRSAEEIVSVTGNGGKMIIESEIKSGKAVAHIQDTYQCTKNGILITSKLKIMGAVGQIERFGKVFHLPKEFDTVKYFGREFESYADMKKHTPLGEYCRRVCNMTEPNIRPQESGNRTDVRTAVISSAENEISFIAVNSPFELGLKPYSDKELRSMKHREDETTTGTYVAVQAFQKGIGTGSCGPETLPEYTFDAGNEYVFSFEIRHK